MLSQIRYIINVRSRILQGKVVVMQEDNNFNNDFDQGNDTSYNSGKQTDQNNTSNRYSSSYSPPNYSPNFIILDEHEKSGAEGKYKRSKSRTGLVLVLSITIILLSTLLLWSIVKLNSMPSDSMVDMGDERMTVIRNSPQINLVNNSDVEYEPKSISEVVRLIGNSVVEITTASVATDGIYKQYVTSGAGSGVIITQSEDAGYLLTNNHVIEGAKEIFVRLTNGDEYEAQVLGSDASIDLAVLRIEKKADESFTVAPLGDSSKLSVGQQVIAIGNPLGSLGGTVTDGIISALDRNVKIDNVSMVLLQHNAAINPGNSGGGLFDDMGNLIGIVNAKTSQTGIEGLGFAIPVNIANDFFYRVMVTEPAMGIKVAYARVNRIPGVYVIDALDSSEFKKLDRIVSINGEEILSEADYSAAMSKIKIDEEVEIVVQRSKKTFTIKLLIE